MRRTATLALTAALMATGTSAALAQGPPSDIPAPPAQAEGSPATGQERSAEALENAEPQGSPATGQERSAEARENAQPQGSPATGQERSAEAREDGRAFGEQRALEAQERGEDENADVNEPVETQDVDGEEVPDGDVDDVELPEVPEQAEEARGVLATITDALKSALDAIKGLFS